MLKHTIKLLVHAAPAPWCVSCQVYICDKALSAQVLGMTKDNETAEPLSINGLITHP